MVGWRRVYGRTDKARSGPGVGRASAIQPSLTATCHTCTCDCHRIPFDRACKNRLRDTGFSERVDGIDFAISCRDRISDQQSSTDGDRHTGSNISVLLQDLVRHGVPRYGQKSAVKGTNLELKRALGRTYTYPTLLYVTHNSKRQNMLQRNSNTALSHIRFVCHLLRWGHAYPRESLRAADQRHD